MIVWYLERLCVNKFISVKQTKKKINPWFLLKMSSRWNQHNEFIWIYLLLLSPRCCLSFPSSSWNITDNSCMHLNFCQIPETGLNALALQGYCESLMVLSTVFSYCVSKISWCKNSYQFRSTVSLKGLIWHLIIKMIPPMV